MNQRELLRPTSFPGAHIGADPGKTRLKALMKKFEKEKKDDRD